MMGHVWNHEDEIIIAAKGSPEKILSICNIDNKERKLIEDKMVNLSKEGLRVIAVGRMKVESSDRIPQSIKECKLTFCGLIGLSDPPRETVKADIEQCVKAGIRVVMITGDNGITASAIAKKIGMINSNEIITGADLDKMSDEELREHVKSVSIFSRVVPEHKMRIVKAFKENGEIVAMTGDGVNDAPALKYADIGIAMGRRGSEVSREAADLILMDDNFSTIVDTIKDGRRIYDNIRKAVGYVFTIHIPIAAASLFAPFLGINPSSLLLLPLHVVLLELIIDPTCSIVLERQPAEENIMDRKPRPADEKLINGKSLMVSVIQGIVMFAASFGTYYFLLKENPQNSELARTMGLAIIIFANLFLVQVISSKYDYVFKSFRILAKDKVMWIVNGVTLVGLILIIYTPLNKILKLSALSLEQFILAATIGGISVFWYEVVKFVRCLKINKQSKICENCIYRLNNQCSGKHNEWSKLECINKVNVR